MKDRNVAIRLLKNLDEHIIVTGCTGSGKSTFLMDAQIPDSKYFDFVELTQCLESETPFGYRYLGEKNFAYFGDDLINSPEKTLILDSVDGLIQEGSALLEYFKTARKHGKRLIVVTWSDNIKTIKPLFGAVITLSGGSNGIERSCDIELIK